MHSTAKSYGGAAILYCGGMVVTLERHSFDAHELFAAVERRRVTTITIVGDAFAKPMTRALEERAATGRPYDGSSIRTIYSAGVVWSADVKERLFEHLPGVILVDNCGSSEGAWYGTSVVRKGDPTSSAAFIPAPGVLLLDEDGRPHAAGLGEARPAGQPDLHGGLPQGPREDGADVPLHRRRLVHVPGDSGSSTTTAP